VLAPPARTFFFGLRKKWGFLKKYGLAIQNCGGDHGASGVAV